MKHLYLRLFAAVCCIIAFFAVLGYVGDIDYCEQVILRMSQEDYDSVSQRLTREKGRRPTQREIAHWWTEHHSDL